MELHRRFSPLNLLMLSINGMIGSAWLFAPLYAAKIAGGAAVISWLIGGAATALIALTFAELSVLLPVAGGTAQIPQLSHGAFASFIIGWAAWLSALTMAPIEVQAVLQYASTYFTSLTHMVDGAVVLTGIGFCWAIVLMLGLCIVNIASFKGLVGFNFLLFLFKVCVIVLTIFMLVTTSFNVGNFANIPTSITSIGGWQAILAAVASGGVAFAFTGFKHGVELAGETKRPNIAIPLAVVGSIVCCLIMYLGLQIAFIGALKPEALSNGWQQLSFAGDFGPFAGLAAGLGLIWLLKLLYVDATVSPLGAGLIYVTSTARILYAMSKIGYVPAFLSRLSGKKFPVFAIFANFAVGMFLFLPLPGWQAMVSFLVSAMVISYAIGPVALICLRAKLPEEERKFRLPVANLLCPLAFYFCNLLSYWTGWETVYKLAIAITCGLIFFVVACLRGKVKFSAIGLKAVFWMVPYLSGLALISYLGAFGGKNIIPFGWDFIVLAVFSLVMFGLGVLTRSAKTDEQLVNFKLAQMMSF
ncbi:MAG TPA: APC family permease [Gammaproteobacteria bacterium]|nr:APC family permease [Gammaproteobacteria bacterium]